MTKWETRLNLLNTYRKRTDRISEEIRKEFVGKLVRITKIPNAFQWEGHVKKTEIKGRIVILSCFSSNYGDNSFHGDIMRKDMTDTLCKGRITLSYDEFKIMDENQ